MQSTSSELSKPILSKVLKAGAGTGKTTTLVNQICSVLEGSKELPNMVVTTFTRKAAGELRERLIAKALEKDRIDWVDYFQSQKIIIGTIHGVLQRFLRGVYTLLERDSQFQVVAPAQADAFRKTIFFSLVKDGGLKGWDGLEISVESLLSLFKDYKRLKAYHGELKPMTNKDQESLATQFVQDRFKSLVIDGEVLLEQTETPKIREGIQKTLDLLGAFIENPKISALAASIETLGSKPAASKAKEDPQFITDFEAWWKEFKGIEKKLEVPAFDSTKWPEFSKQFVAFQKLAEEYLVAEHEHRNQMAWMEIDDLEIVTLELLRSEPELVKQFAADWNYWLIDEYQDTSPFQEKILSALSGDSPYFVVGDPQQSIYLFRDADPGVFLRKQEEALADGVKVEPLSQNFRSRPDLLEFFNDFFDELLPNYQVLSPYEGTGLPNSSEKDPVATFIEVPESDTRGLENLAVLNRIRELQNQGVSLSKISILGKENGELIRLARYLSQNDVTVFLHTAGSFWNKREVKDALALLLFLINPWDDENLIALLRSPWFWMADADIVDLRSNKAFAKKPLWAVLKESNLPMAKTLIALQDKKSSDGLIEVFEKALIDHGFYHLCHWIDPSGRREANLFKLVGKIRTQSKTNSSILELARAQSHALDRDFDDPDGEAVAALMPDAVNMMTVHSSKGLKFEHVILIRADKVPMGSGKDVTYSVQADDQGKFAIALPLGENQELKGSALHVLRQAQLSTREKEEHFRLLYVALTRAQVSVTVTMEEEAAKGSWIAACQKWLAEGEHKKGNYHWSSRKGAGAAVGNPSRKSDEIKIPAPVEWTYKDSARVRSVTEVLTKKSGPGYQPVLLADPIDTYFAAPRGSRFHRKMELIKYHGLESVLQKYGQDQEFWKAIKYLKGLKAPNWSEVLDSGEAEWAFQYKTADGIIDGKIDIWGEDKAGVIWIIDYKTGSPQSNAKAFDQLHFYAYPLREKFPDKKIKLAAIYPFAEQLFVEDSKI